MTSDLTNEAVVEKARLGIVLPSLRRENVMGTALLAATQAQSIAEVKIFEFVGSLLAHAFNTCWCWLLHMRKEGITHGLLVHADIQPVTDGSGVIPNWIDALMGEMEKCGAGVLSGIVPIKDLRGLTSTALDTDLWRPQRITMKQAWEQLPETWSCPELLFNTGLMLVDFRQPWVEKVCFTIKDELVVGEDGEFYPQAEPEDWNMSRQVRQLGVKAAVTRKVLVNHYGYQAWSNNQIWGEAADPNNAVGGDFTITAADGAVTTFSPRREEAK